ncbi:MAG: hypothetical protein A3D35_02320 [Candidatus Staskawiczbacteria bacterium RIFCSPHIGHO2_02_FULL_34_9]|uniref:Spore protein YkvP/CgeB glycosyl transferase-like domain-containing protein n=1 Tax=Candidatus Staskawiczbacteria bacterium RIFCSPHIGHO2_02_FULL_34_9 TaxID=1802206 RepID=A0A1G2I198_9BACT|nr:MAG: hypothetical protein A3D35_02320 [Candidatus Staskawiczbacteria bacterium RIFCSPHIGHO2_02_FULL_34_9]
MKIIFVACKYDYGNPDFGFSYEYYNLYESLVNMNNRENQVILFPFDEIILKVGRDEMNNQLLETVEREKPDLCFFFLFQNQIKEETVKRITNSGTKTLNWFADDKWRFDSFSRHWAPLFSWISTDEPSRVKDYNKIGYNNVVVGGWGCNQNLYKPIDVPKIYDVTFIGQPHGDRKKVVEKIKNAGIKIECFGRGWPNGKVSQEEMIKIFNQSKINLNFSACSGKIGLLKGIGRIFFSNGKFHSPVKWIINFKTFLARQQNEIKGRNFEIPGCNSFILSGYAKGLENYYELDKELVCFYSDQDLIKKIKYYLSHEDEREKIAKAAYDKTMQNYTYEKKFNQIFKTIGLI